MVATRGGGGVCVHVHVCMHVCMGLFTCVCAWGKGTTKKREKKDGKVNLRKSPHCGFEHLLPHACGSTVLSPVLLPKC